MNDLKNSEVIKLTRKTENYLIYLKIVIVFQDFS